jgi:predicted DNA-binding protein
MYTYIVERTQIYLSKAQAGALDREARRTGVTRSHLIREAIDRTYLATPANEELLAALEATAGAWHGRAEDGEAYVERIRADSRLTDLWGQDTDVTDVEQ